MRKALRRAALGLCLWAGLFAVSGAGEPGGKASREVKAKAEAEKAEKRAEFILGNIVFIVFHEFGHALVSEYELPVLGREEDAVDRFATFLLTPEGDEDEESDPSTILIDSMRGWFAASERTELDDIQWWGEHGPDQQRAYQIACLLYGADPDTFGEMADEVGLPEARKESCPQEAESNSASWLKVVEPHTLDDGEEPEYRVRVSYGAGGKYGPELALLKESQLLEGIASDLSTSLRFPRNVTIRAKTCGEPNAYWDSEAAEIQVCYELLREYGELFDDLKK